MAEILAVLLRYEKLIQDVANISEKKVNPIVFKGDIVALSKAAKGLMNEILTHALRNSVDHGIETPDIRKSNNKTEAGNVMIQFDLIDNVYSLVISDDGQGLNMHKIRNKAVEKGLLDSDAAAKMNDIDTCELLFVAGFSTAAKVSEISGRGDGMDAVRKAAHELGGHVTTRNAKGGGSDLLVILSLREQERLK